MIAGTLGRIETKTARDHDRRPECLNAKLRHNGQSGRFALLRFPTLPIDGAGGTPTPHGVPRAVASGTYGVNGTGEDLARGPVPGSQRGRIMRVSRAERRHRAITESAYILTLRSQVPPLCRGQSEECASCDTGLAV